MKTAYRLLGVPQRLGFIGGSSLGSILPEASFAEHGSGSWEYLDDVIISAKVQASVLSSTAAEVLALAVSTLRGVVRLSGTVRSARQGRLAVRAATNVSGVRSVLDELVVG